MSGHQTETLLATTPEAAFDYLTRPALWHEWHHSSLWAEPHAAEPMRAGDTFREHIRALGIRKELHWRVLQAEVAREWRAEASMADGSQVWLHYRFEPDPAGTRFTRTLDYALRPWPLRLLNLSVGWLKLRRDTRRALSQLQARFRY